MKFTSELIKKSIYSVAPPPPMLASALRIVPNVVSLAFEEDNRAHVEKIENMYKVIWPNMRAFDAAFDDCVGRYNRAR